MCEIWRAISGFEGYYEVSSLGRVKSLPRPAGRKTGQRSHSGGIVKPQDNGNGYKKLTLSAVGRKKQAYVHRLVAEAFIPNPLGYSQVNHIDGDKANNAASNLEWCTGAENMQHSYDTGLHVVSEKARRALSLGKFHSVGNHRKPVVRDDGRTYETVKEAAEDLQIDARGISAVLTGRQKTVGGHSFKYRS